MTYVHCSKWRHTIANSRWHYNCMQHVISRPMSKEHIIFDSGNPEQLSSLALPFYVGNNTFHCHHMHLWIHDIFPGENRMCCNLCLVKQIKLCFLHLVVSFSYLLSALANLISRAEGLVSNGYFYMQNRLSRCLI